jgi:hypothetical protein
VFFTVKSDSSTSGPGPLRKKGTPTTATLTRKDCLRIEKTVTRIIFATALLDLEQGFWSFPAGGNPYAKRP